MRGFFFLLLLTNVALGAWQYFERGSSEPKVDVYRNIPLVADGLTMISELPADKRPALREKEPSPDSEAAQASGSEGGDAAGSTGVTGSTDVAQAVEPKPPVQTKPLVKPKQEMCYHISDIEDQQSLDTLIAWLKKRGATAIEQSQHQATKKNFWVMLPAYSSRAKANEAAGILKDKRVRDFFIVRSGEHENAISLGVFSTHERAERRYQEIAKLNARLRKPRIDSIELPAKRYLLNYRLKDDDAVAELARYLEKEQLGKVAKNNCR